MLLHIAARNWWSIVLRGVCAILFGLLAWVWPGVTLSVLVLLWAGYTLADGVLALAGAFSRTSTAPWWALLIIGLVSLFAAAFAIFFPGLTAVGLLYLIGFWAIVTGALEIVAAIQLRREIEGEFWLGFAGLASILFGVLLIMRPGLGALAVMWMIGTYAIALGILLIAHGLHVRSLALQQA
jgi:uncharacterized membrane protein HdeD (DUF308 family)